MKNHYFDNNKPLRPYTFSADANANSESPENALRTEPEFKDGYHPCEKGGKWIQVEDHRKATVYSTQTGERVEVKEVGALPEQVTDKPKPDAYHTWNGKKWTMTQEAQAQKQADEQAAEHTAKLNEAEQAMAHAKQQIDALNFSIELEGHATDEELANLQAELKAWKKQIVELNKFINGQRADMPELI